MTNKHRPRLSPEEWDIIQEAREIRASGNAALQREKVHDATRNAIKALKDKYQTGRKTRQQNGREQIQKLHAQIAEGKALIEAEGLPPVLTGVVPGIDEDIMEGHLRDDVVVDVTSESVGIISDAHWPFHDLRRDAAKNYYGAYITALQELRAANIGTLILNGDMMDCFHLSSHEKLEARRDWKWELDVSRAMLRHLRSFFGDKVRIIYREGNHEERFERYMSRHAKELQGVYDIAELLKLREQGIEWASGRAKMTIGKLWVDHGHEWFGGGGVMPARNYRMKAVDNIIVGHVHKTSQDLFRRPLKGDFIAGWSVGCLCDLNPHYAPRNNWNHGFAHVTLAKDGSFTVANRVIIDGIAR